MWVEGVEGAQVVQVLAHVASADVPADLGLLLDLIPLLFVPVSSGSVRVLRESECVGEL